MSRKRITSGNDFWADIDTAMRRTAEQYKEAVNKNSGGDGWVCLSLGER